MDAMFDAIQAAPRDHTNEPIFYPGDREYRTAQQRSRDGVPITNTERRDFRELAEKFNVAMPR
jgi:LDH2 family malate/lactate/ureidoglycolate dehydrogenase